MRPRPNHIIVKAHVAQKETLTFGTLTLYIPRRRQLSERGNVVNPTVCEVVASNEDYLKEGDLLVLGHNSLENKAWMIEEKDEIRTLSLPIDRWILGKLGTQGELLPLFGNTVCKRLYQPDASSIIITPDAYKKTEENKVIVLAVAPDVKDLKEGVTGIIFTRADYEIHYTVNNEEKSAVVIFSEDVVAVEQEELA